MRQKNLRQCETGVRGSFQRRYYSWNKKEIFLQKLFGKREMERRRIISTCLCDRGSLYAGFSWGFFSFLMKKDWGKDWGKEAFFSYNFLKSLKNFLLDNVYHSDMLSLSLISETRSLEGNSDQLSFSQKFIITLSVHSKFIVWEKLNSQAVPANIEK